MKQINIFGRKISIVAVLMIALLIGTASAAMIVNYASLTGTVNVPSIIDTTGDSIEFTVTTTGEGTTGTGTLTITNAIGSDVVVSIDTELWVEPDGEGSAESYMVTDTTGITISYDVTVPTNPGDIDGDYELVSATALGGTGYPVVAGNTDVIVSFTAIPGVVTGVYTIHVDVNPVGVSSV